MSDDVFEPAARAFVSQGLKLTYWDWGNEAAPLLVLLHGSGDHARMWDDTARALAGDYHVIAPDLRGHGESQWSPDGAYATQYFVLDFVNMLDALGEGAKRMTLVAHSFGGAIAMRFAAIYPDRVTKLCIVDGLGPAPAFRARWAEEGVVSRARGWINNRRETAARPGKRFASIEEAAKRLQKERPRLTDDLALHLARHGARRDGDAYVWKRDPLVSVFTNEDFALESNEVRAHVTAPILLFWGPESWTSNPDLDGRVETMRDHKTIVFQEAGHWLHHDQPEDFMRTLRAFLT